MFFIYLFSDFLKSIYRERGYEEPLNNDEMILNKTVDFNSLSELGAKNK